MESDKRAEGYRAIITDYALQSRWTDVRRFAIEWLKLDPTEPFAHYWAGWAATQQGDLEAAQFHAHSIGDRSLQSGYAQLLWAEIHFARRELTASLDAIEQAIALSPETPAFYQVLCKVRLTLGQPALALTAIETALALEPQNASFQLLRGVASRLAKHEYAPESALREIDYLKSVLTIDPRNPWVLARIGVVLALELHDYRSAVAFLRQSLEIDPTNALALRQYRQAQHNLHFVYRILYAPVELSRAVLRPRQVLSQIKRAKWLVVPIWLYAVSLLLIGCVFNAFWTLLPAMLYRVLIFTDACKWDARWQWQATLYDGVARIPILARVAIWTSVSLAVLCVQAILLCLYAPVLFVGIPFGCLAAAVSWRERRNASLAMRRSRKEKESTGLAEDHEDRVK